MVCGSRYRVLGSTRAKPRKASITSILHPPSEESWPLRPSQMENTNARKAIRMPYLPPNASVSTRWLAVSRRDHTANSSFFYGAISTRIFCRPTCPGRLARRSNVVFFDDQTQAVDSGYRPCKRCQPCNDEWSRGSEGRMLAYGLCDLIVAAHTGGTPWTVEAFAEELGTSGAHLHRQFKKHCHLTPKSFGASLRCSEIPRPPPHAKNEDEHLVITDPPATSIQPEQVPLGSLLQTELANDKSVQNREVQDPVHTMVHSVSSEELGVELFSVEAPGSDFVDILALEEFLDFDGYNPSI